MTQQQKIIKLAEFEGWRKEYIHGNGVDTDVWIHPNGKDCREEEWFPNYFQDLNAVRKLEEKLTDEQWTDYLNNLYYITFKPAAKDRDKQAVHASAEDKCEALGKTLKLWS